jgi:hypothetical protein
MRKWLFAIILFCVCATTIYYTVPTLIKQNNSSITIENFTNNTYLNKLQIRAISAKLFIEQKKYNDKICFLVDMSLPSNKNRFFVYDLDKDSIVLKGLVAHGSCNNIYLRNAQFSNTPECGCSAIGKYRVGKKYKGRFGNAFKLHGLDSTNNNAYERFIVLHAYDCVPNEEVDYLICNSLGCPMVSYTFLKGLSMHIANSKKPILLWMF